MGGVTLIQRFGGRALGARVGMPLLLASIAGLSILVTMRY
jgi:hypothetical protein